MHAPLVVSLSYPLLCHPGRACLLAILEKRDATRSVALYAKHYQNSDMIDLRYSWHQKDEADRTALGLTDALPATEGFSERLFNVGHEW